MGRNPINHFGFNETKARLGQYKKSELYRKHKLVQTGPDKTEVKAAQQTLNTIRMSKTNYHTGSVEECQF